MEKSHKIVYGVYILVWAMMAINPKYPQDWLLENVLLFLFFTFDIITQFFGFERKHMGKTT